MTQLTCSRLVTFVYLKFTQMLILKVVSNNSINGLQCYSFKILICLCYGWDKSNGSWGLFWVVFWTSPIKTTPRRTSVGFVLWNQKKATQSVIKWFSKIIDAQWATGIMWQCRSVDFILSQFLTFVCEATWFIHTSQLCSRPKVNYPDTQPGRSSI